MTSKELIFLGSTGDNASVGLQLSYILSLLGLFQYIMRQAAEAESYVCVFFIHD